MRPPDDPLGGREGESTEEYYNRAWGTRWMVPRHLTRAVRRFVRDRDFGTALLIGQPVLGYGPDGGLWVPGMRNLITSAVPAPTVTTGGDGAGLHFQRLRRSGGIIKERWYRDWGPTPFHHILDPTGAQAVTGIIAQDLLVPTFDSGAARVFFGLLSFNTATDETSRTGICWRTDSATLKWISGVYDGTGTPSTTLHETTHDDLSFAATGAADSHRLGFWIEPVTKTVYFYANGALVDQYTPTAPLAEMSNCPHLYHYGISDSGADASLYTLGGGNPRLLTLVPAS